MFTNWLTNATANSENTRESTVSIHHHHQQQQHHRAATANLISSNFVMSTPPDVILEIGPAPSVRFVAHSLILGMHSGYLRSAIRLDENAAATSASTLVHHGHSGHATHHGHDLILYLSNVTPDQFAPLLTYMYTGYLDLNVDNIFGVLLATHVLHMPRALEICRSFLARAQSEGYMGQNVSQGINSMPSLSTTTASTTLTNKIIRPIPSKPTIPNFGFMPLTTAAAAAAAIASHQQQHSHLPNAALVNAYKNIAQMQQHQPQIPMTSTARSTELPQLATNFEKTERLKHDKDVEVREEAKPKLDANVNNNEDLDDEEVEVFIDSNSFDAGESDDNEVETENDCNISVGSSSCMRLSKECKILKVQQLQQLKPQTISKDECLELKEHQFELNKRAKTPALKTAAVNSTKSKRRSSGNKRNQRHRKHGSVSGLQIAKAPIPASQLDGIQADQTPQVASPRFIIDVASCDGPVRFRRILNTAYGHRPDKLALPQHQAVQQQPHLTERTQQSVSLSFHQQMAKAINQQRLLQHSEESENSESSASGGTLGASSAVAPNRQSKSLSAAAVVGTNEIYVCVYCKHTFKSQYCYQKHAKRHLNPLSLKTAAAARNDTVVDEQQQLSSTCSTSATDVMKLAAPRQLPTQLPSLATNKQHAAELLRREVRPLDMNVQYYPCKTCGSKFPSYYFVHKHRKMCHADEEQQQQHQQTLSSNEVDDTADDGEAQKQQHKEVTENNKPPIEGEADNGMEIDNANAKQTMPDEYGTGKPINNTMDEVRDN